MWYRPDRNDNYYKMKNGIVVEVDRLESTIKKYIKNNFIIFGENMDYNILIMEQPLDLNKIKEINNNLNNSLKIKDIILLTKEEMNNCMTSYNTMNRKKLIKYILIHTNICKNYVPPRYDDEDFVEYY